MAQPSFALDALAPARSAPTPTAQPFGGPAPTADLREVAREFESLLLDMMIKAMRDSVPRSDLFGDSEKTKTYEMMRDQELSRAMSRSGGVGFADMIVRQFEGREDEGLRTLADMGQKLRSASRSYQEYGGAAAMGGMPPREGEDR